MPPGRRGPSPTPSADHRGNRAPLRRSSARFRAWSLPVRQSVRSQVTSHRSAAGALSFRRYERGIEISCQVGRAFDVSLVHHDLDQVVDAAARDGADAIVDLELLVQVPGLLAFGTVELGEADQNVDGLTAVRLVVEPV